jgi:hypothetical protein
MNIKILCSCTTKFSFDVEPVDGKMPVEIFCPKCGVDVTEQANTMIQQQSSSPETPVAIAGENKPRIGLRVASHVAKPASSDGGVAAMPGVEMCFRHPRNVATEHCVVCKKPICPECMQSFGFLCSINCRYRAEQEQIAVPVYKLQKSNVEKGALRKTLAITGVVACLVVGLIGLWFWYVLSGSKPRPYYTWKFPASKHGSYAKFMGPNKILLLKSDEILLHDIKSKSNLWTTALPDPKPPVEKKPIKVIVKKASDPDPDEEIDYEKYNDSSSVTAPPFFNGDDVWIPLSHNVLCVDLKSGALKYTIQYRGRLSAFTPGESTLLVVSERAPTKKLVTRITLASGEAKSAEVASSLRERVSTSKDLPANVLPTAAMLMKYQMEGAEKNLPSIYKLSSEFFSAGQNIVEMQVKLIEPKVTFVQTMKAPTASKHLNDSTTASTSARSVAEEIFNDMKRSSGGGVRPVDESRYGVLLRRSLETGAPDWSGEVDGLPTFFPCKTVDVLIAGKNLTIFDKQNKKLADVVLSYAIDEEFSSGYGNSGASPCVEKDNTLYVFDKGVLTAFELPGGTVRWRLTSVGVRGIQFDDKKNLYVSTTTASPEDIQYSDQIKMNDSIKPILLKVDPSGKTLWKSDQSGGGCFLTGKYLYLTDAARGEFAMVAAAEDAFGVESQSGGNFRIYRLDPANGKKLWAFDKAGWPSNIDFSENRILLHFGNEIQIMKFISF